MKTCFPQFDRQLQYSRLYAGILQHLVTLLESIDSSTDALVRALAFYLKS